MSNFLFRPAPRTRQSGRFTNYFVNYLRVDIEITVENLSEIIRKGNVAAFPLPVKIAPDREEEVLALIVEAKISSPQELHKVKYNTRQ